MYLSQYALEQMNKEVQELEDIHNLQTVFQEQKKFVRLIDRPIFCGCGSKIDSLCLKKHKERCTYSWTKIVSKCTCGVSTHSLPAKIKHMKTCRNRPRINLKDRKYTCPMCNSSFDTAHATFLHQARTDCLDSLLLRNICESIHGNETIENQ